MRPYLHVVAIPSLAVAPSDPDAIWLGADEGYNLRSSNGGTGAYMAPDEGKTSSKAMLPTSR